MYHSSLGQYFLLFSSSHSSLFLICSEASACLEWNIINSVKGSDFYVQLWFLWLVQLQALFLCLSNLLHVSDSHETILALSYHTR